MVMITVKFGKDRYHLQETMIKWCREHISANYGWREPNRERWGDDWGIACAFGTTFFYFVDEEDAMFFKLRWL